MKLFVLLDLESAQIETLNAKGSLGDLNLSRQFEKVDLNVMDNLDT
jgi:hypothetical protein